MWLTGHYNLIPNSQNYISPHLASLHWLPIDSRMLYKLVSRCYNCFNSTAPGYLTKLRIFKPTRQLFSNTSILCLSSVCTRSFGQRSFSYAAPSVWNSVPCKFRSSNTLASSRSLLKSHLVKLSC